MGSRRKLRGLTEGLSTTTNNQKNKRAERTQRQKKKTLSHNNTFSGIAHTLKELTKYKKHRNTKKRIALTTLKNLNLCFLFFQFLQANKY